MNSRSMTEQYASKHGKIYWLFHDSSVIAWRNLLRFRRNPEVLFFDVVQPIIFILLLLSFSVEQLMWAIVPIDLF